MSESLQECDVLVAGGGPAGSTISALLSEKGWDVVLLEKDRHPRFHIGESLLPHNLPIFDRLGVMDDIARIGVVKRGVDFPRPSGDGYLTFAFAEAFQPCPPSAFQVKRAEFDHVLLRNSARKGTRVLEGVTATHIDLNGADRVDVRGAEESGVEHRWRARFLVDASGRDTLLAGRLNLKRRNRKHNSAAVYAHFTGVERRPGEAAGNIGLFWFEHGWFWLIPLRDGITSVGAVCWARYLRTRKGPLDQFLLDTIARCPPLAARMNGAALARPATATGNYSYFASRMFGDRYLLIGDAYAFIDPVFSTGVYLAMRSGVLGAETVDACLKDPRRTKTYLRRHDRTVRRGLTTLSWFIYRFTDPALRSMFLAPRNLLGMQRAVISLLAGDVYDNRRLRLPLLLFKAIYRLLSLINLRASLANIRKRRDQTTASPAP